MRKQPGPPPEIQPKTNNEIITQVREYELITPLFGGGVDKGEADPVTMIRGSEIRGQLRFWWRACRGGQFSGNLAEMKKAEDRLWGKAYNKNEDAPSQDQLVQITVETSHSGETVQPFNIISGRTGRKAKPNSDRYSPPSYASFPLQPSDDDLRKADFKQNEVQVNVKFRLTISFSAKSKTDVEAALWAWETFGGIGARTRRGFGALHLSTIDGKKNPDVDKTQVHQWIRERLIKFVIPGNYPEGLPYLSQNLQLAVIDYTANQNAFIAWTNLITKLKNFRQARSQGTSGRSLWPEPAAIREITSRSNADSHIHKFPRAAFGLPIIFHFKDGNRGDPEDTTLQGSEKGSERLASPLILRPLFCKDGQAVGIALLLEGSHIPPGGIALVEKRGSRHSVDTTLTPDQARNIPMLQGEANVLKAFMNYLGGNNR